MVRGLIISLLLTLPCCAQGPILDGIMNTGAAASSGTFSLVQKNADGTSGTSMSISLPNTAAGNLIVVIAGGRGSAAGSWAISDTPNGAYTLLTTCANSVREVQIGYVISGAGGSLTISVSRTNTTTMWASAREYHSTTSITFDARACTATPGSSSTPTGDSLSASGANNLIVAGMEDFNATSGGCNVGWTNCGHNTDQATTSVVETEDLLNQALGSYAGAFTLGTAQTDWIVGTASFKN